MSDRTPPSPRIPLVTVVVPVFDPGSAIDSCIDSLLAQTLEPGAYEVVFVDDGSTDDTPARLDDLAARHGHIRVIHQPNSGWPGKPRNVGIQEARGEFIQFVDQDDRLGPEALERCVAMGQEHGTDIVIGKVTSDFRGVPHGLFRRDRAVCTVFDAPLIDSLTPHKLFRTAFLRGHGIAFPEGRRRLEDQLFMVRAYFAGARVSILASYPCYFYLERADRANAASARIDPDGYYGNLREVLDVVVAATEPGEVRDGMLRRFYRVEMLSRVDGSAFIDQDEAYRERLVSAIRRLASEVMTPGAEAGLSPLARLRAELVREGRSADLAELARRLTPIQAQVRVAGASWTDGRLSLDVVARFVDRDRHPVSLHQDGTRLVLDPRLTHGLSRFPVDVGPAVGSTRLEVYLRDPDTFVQWRAREVDPVDVVRRDEQADQVAGHLETALAVIVEPLRLAGGGALPEGCWKVVARLVGIGLDARTAVAPPDRPVIAAYLGDPPRVHVLDAGGQRLTVQVDQRPLDTVIDTAAIERRRSGGRTIEAVLPLAAGPRTPPQPIRVTLHGPRGTASRNGSLVRVGNRWRVRVSIGPVRGRLRGGTYELRAALDGPSALDRPDAPDRTWTPLGMVKVDRLGRVGFAGLRRVGVGASARYHALNGARGAGRRLPAPVKRRLRVLRGLAGPRAWRGRRQT